MNYCLRCGAELEPHNTTGLCVACVRDQDMLDDCERDARAERAQQEARIQEKREYHIR